jgi:hypothetical protein
MTDKENEDETIVLSPDDWDVLTAYTIDDEIDSKQCAVIVNWLNTTERSIRSGLTRLGNEQALSSEVRHRRIQSCKSWLRLIELMRFHVANLEADEHYPENDDD